MNIEHRLQLLQQQKLVLTPELKQAIIVLQLPLLELEPFLQQQIEENPVLELETGEKEELSLDAEDKEQNTEEWLVYFADRSDLGINNATKAIPIEQPVASLPNLKEFLEEQAMLAFDASDRKAVFFIIDNIDENGYLQLTYEEVCKHVHISESHYIDLLSKIQLFEPAGVGARNLSECLSLQISHKGFSPQEEGLLLKLVNFHLNDVANGRIVKLAQEYKLTPLEIQHYIDIIKKLNPHPGASYSSASPFYIVPDIVVEKVSGEFIIIVNDAALPRITMSETYLALLNKHDDEQVKKYVQQKVNAATWLLRSIEQRRLTLYKVANAILEKQYTFFELGVHHLKPLILKQIAHEVELHESTVSRAVANKYIQTPHGVFPMKFFFTGGLATLQGEDKAARAIKERIKELIEQENDKKPLSDQAIADILNEEGINISRRTVAKYREELRILSSAKRKRY